jgi:phosphocarrier protein FPr
MSTVILRAPLSGLLIPIEQVPDPAFAEKMVGDGVALDPVNNVLHAPCDGRVIHLHDAHHAITIGGPDGLEVLMHIGLDTIQLRGEGFMAHVAVGDEVQQGDVLIEFDLDYVAQNAPSLLTMIVIANSDKVLDFGKASGMVRQGEDAIMVLTVGEAEIESAEIAAMAVSSDAILIPNAAGLHARPAAVLANLARKFGAEIQLVKQDKVANAKSIIGIMNLDVGMGDSVTLKAEGPDAQEAINTLVPAIRSGLGEEGALPIAAPASVAQAASDAPAPRAAAENPNILEGATASPGLAVGNVLQLRRLEMEVDPQPGGDAYAERSALDNAILQASQDLEALQARLHGEADPGKAAIFAAHEELLHDPDLLDMTQEAITNGRSAAFAWQTAVNTQAERLETMTNQLLAVRANDLRDVGRRVLAYLTGVSIAPLSTPPNTILIAEDLSPSDMATLDRSKVVGFATTLGGATSHVAILARALDLPAVAGIEPRALELRNGTPVILDATKGKMRLNPRPEQIAYIVGMLRKREQKRRADFNAAQEPAITTDGHRMEVVANISSQADAEQAMLMGAEGVGLLRTEFLFLERRSAPTEDEQAAAYAAIAGVLGSKKPLIIRTLDVGGDKPLPYLPIASETNPFLGERGIRIGLNRPQLLRTQVRAILRASSAGGNIHIMFPMIATLDEWQMAKALLDEEVADLGVKGIPVGIMVEVPAAAIMAEQFARDADFFSIGTNDLTQYVLAMDRSHPKLASRVDGLNPAVLRLIAHTTAGALKHDRWVGVCGGMASDPQAAPLLMGLGVKELSASVPAIPTMKALLRSLSYAEAQEKAQEALGLSTAAEVRALYPLEDYEL